MRPKQLFADVPFQLSASFHTH